MTSLIIGDTSQLSFYFPTDHVRIPSREIEWDFIASKRWDNIFLCFAEQRTFLDNDPSVFFDVNYSYTKNVVDKIKDLCDRLYFYSTTYLWNAYQGYIDLSMPYKYLETPYIKSKDLISTYIMKNIPNAVILYPCNFNSIHRKGGFLFCKIFDSIIHKKRITIGNTHFLKELVHPRYVVRESLMAKDHTMIGAGYAIDVNEFIRDLYGYFGLDYGYFVKEEFAGGDLVNQPPAYFTRKEAINYTRDNLMRDTIEELEKCIKW